ncbi:MAG: dihydroorotase, partial [Halanaerobium sp. MSAO_Bac5]
MKTLIKNAEVFDPRNDLEGKYDILIEGKNVIQISENIKNQGYELIDATDKVVIPALIDMHTHLREPGYEDKETVKTGCEAAAAGGFSAVAAMPNTNPVADNPAVVEHLNLKSKEALVKVYPVGSITQGSKGEKLSEIGTLAKTGVKALTDDGNPVMNSEIMRRAMEYASAFDLPIIDRNRQAGWTRRSRP